MFNGISGYKRIAIIFYNGNMQKAYVNLSMIFKSIGKDLGKELGWGGYTGTVDEFMIENKSI